MRILNKIVWVGITIATTLLYGQASEISFGDFPKPVPSVSSLSTYVNSPMSNASGIPGISIPLLQLPTYNGDVNLSIGLSYNPMNVSEYEPASQTGTGWSLFAGSVISRSIVAGIDEAYDDVNYSKYIKNTFDDIYYYNLPGISGKFRFKRNIDNNTFELINLTSNKVKITYIAENNTATLIVQSFTIIDEKGIQYIFNDFSRSNKNQDDFTLGGKVYKSAFYLTQIKDSNNGEVANFSYQKDTRYKTGSSTISYEICKLKTISSPGVGKLEISYVYDPSMERTMNDPYQVDKITLKDNYSHLISGYSFEYSLLSYAYSHGDPFMNGTSKRSLKKVKKLDKNSIVTETTEFEYADVPVPTPPLSGIDLNSLCYNYSTYVRPQNIGILKRIINPSGGVVEYNFEPHQVYFDHSSSTYLDTILYGDRYSDPEVQYLDSVLDIVYNTKQSTSYNFTVTGPKTRKIFIAFGTDVLFPPPLYWDTNTPTYVDYFIQGAGGQIYGATCGPNTFTREFDLSPGTYTLQITGSGGRGMANIMKLEHLPLPFKDIAYGAGVRIGNIKHYKSRLESVPVSTIKYEYSNFTDSNSSSGYMYYPEVDERAEYYTLYKNVKVSSSQDNNGYIKYYYQTPDDFPQIPYTGGGVNDKFWPYYAITNGGLLDKKEVYNDQNKLLVSEKIDYTFDVIPGAADYLIRSGVYSKLGWLKKAVNTSTSYFENGKTLTDNSETEYTSFNFQPKITRKNIEGNIEEKIFTYPETGYTNLSNAHILNIPVVVEGKLNGNLVSRSETQYNNSSSTRPTSIISSNIGNTAVKTATIDLYDEKGNILQYTGADGMVTATVFGYNKKLPIAKIEGATYAQVSSLMATIVNASDSDAADPSKESELLAALDDFRNNSQLKDFQITTYTYDPLIGATTVTPTTGIREIYKYDSQNRLIQILDMKGMILKEYKYNYKN
ncbi:hypothetical protein C1637_07485 [Chryseobacterium lactis]|uniref:RHS repeat protein n=1 Tax=Chryseobacterium lactis TaxID=1241981 RepID=A0A3G6RU86_CHRLC|nr:hypothetical protein [Chryseobacterium lactis]AZA84671.1 hypothetical protein EG342_23455 [Chryseobacterium lactis]AZB05060.1 hypothetical protein EG341_14335 [Chryseobacterium lactis]PNW14791.1 hypothetical protein C1637_07485 [Chryseobacterium lactis]